jgi:hypothetical protein
VRKHVFVGRQIHLVRVDRAVGGHHVRDRQVGQQRAAQHLQHARNHPARAAGQHRQPPAGTAPWLRLRHETQVVDLLAHLRDQRDAHGHCRAEGHQVERRALRSRPAKHRQPVQDAGVVLEDIDIRHHQHQQPQRLRPHLQPADGGDAVRDQRDHHQRAQQVTPGRRDVEGQFQRIGHHGGFEREEDEREAGVDQRRDRAADVAETGAAGQQVHVDAVARGVQADRQPGQEDDQPGGQDRQRRVDKTVLHQQRRAHGLQDQERRRAEGRVGHAPGAPLAERTRRETQCVVFDRLAGDPAVVVASGLDDTLFGGRVAGVHCAGAIKKRTSP